MNSFSAPDPRESRLEEIRQQAEEKGRVSLPGIRPAGSPLPIASPENGYYQQPLLKEPQWTPLIPLYFFVGGASGSLGVIGSLADLLGGDAKLAQRARWMALGGAAVSSVLLIADLGKPSRFLHMLRVFKPQSTMSMGSWVLSAFSTFAGISAFADVLALGFGNGFTVRALRGIGRIGSVLFGMPFHNYTGVLIGASAIPVWNKRVRSLPRQFGMSGLQSAVGLLELTGSSRNSALNAIGLLSAGFESWQGIDLLRTHDRALRPAKQHASGVLIQAAGVLSGPLPIALRIVAATRGRSKQLRRFAALCGILGSLCMRYGWVRAGILSSRDWKIPLQIGAASANNQDAAPKQK
ncbi:MAG: NrfD/PsrC family molybdoenzyme membrane anchor subunit [Candidatus Sulfotelmatobacter sp.]